MNFFKRDPLVGGVVLLAVIAIGAEGWALWTVRFESTRAFIALEQKKREREDFQEKTPSPTHENEQVTERELSTTREKLMTAEAALAGAKGTMSVAMPPKPIDAYFEIANFVEKTRVLANQDHVTLPLDERFGFGSYAREGPESESLPCVLRQCVAAQFLIETLFETHPAALLRAQREYPLSNGQRVNRNQPRPLEKAPHKVAGTHDEPSDFFQLDPAISIRVPGKIESDAFKLEFTGQTGTLRAFLGRLTSGERSFVVRSVEVEPLTSASIKANLGSSATVSVPIIEPALSQFRVIVELAVPYAEMESPAL